MRSVRAGLALLVLLGAAVGLVPASAAQLTLAAPLQPHSAGAERCDDAVSVTTPSTSGDATSLEISGVDAACAGAAVTVYLRTGSTTTVADLAAASGGGFTVTTAPFDPDAVSAVSVHVGGWPMVTTWTYTPAPASTWCRVEVSSGGTWVQHPTATCEFSGHTLVAAWGNPISHRNVNLTFSYAGVPTGKGVRILASVDLSELVTLGPGQTWATSSVTGWSYLSSSTLPIAQFNYGNSYNGSGQFTSQITISS